MACKWFDICPLRKLEKEGEISSKWQKEYCQSRDNWKDCQRFQMEERGEPHPDNMMPDGSIIRR